MDDNKNFHSAAVGLDMKSDVYYRALHTEIRGKVAVDLDEFIDKHFNVGSNLRGGNSRDVLPVSFWTDLKVKSGEVETDLYPRIIKLYDKIKEDLGMAPTDDPQVVSKANKAPEKGRDVRPDVEAAKKGSLDLDHHMEVKPTSDLPRSLDASMQTITHSSTAMESGLCRRFVYSMTLCTPIFRGWYSDHSGALGSPEIDVLTAKYKGNLTPESKDDEQRKARSCAGTVDSRRRLVYRMIASLLQMTPEDLGYDPTIRSVAKDLPNYPHAVEFTVHSNPDNTYFTCLDPRPRSESKDSQMLNNGSRGLITRATVVLQVKAKENISGDTFVLKDYWRRELESDEETEALSEGKIYDLLAASTEDWDAFVNKYLPGVAVPPLSKCIAWGDVLLPSGSIDSTRNNRKGVQFIHQTDGVPGNYTPLTLNLSPRSHLFQRSDQQKASNSPTVHGSNSGGTNRVPQRELPVLKVDFHNRIHTRVVTDRIGEPIETFRDRKELLQVLLDALHQLYLLHMAGVAHRDISIGNILIKDGRGLLIDLDHASRTGGFEIGGRVTGNDYFKASGLQELPRHRKVRRGFRHDVESFFWVLLWICTFFNGPSMPGRPVEDERLYYEFRQIWQNQPSTFKGKFLKLAYEAYPPSQESREPLISPYFKSFDRLLGMMRGALNKLPPTVPPLPAPSSLDDEDDKESQEHRDSVGQAEESQFEEDYTLYRSFKDLLTHGLKKESIVKTASEAEDAEAARRRLPEPKADKAESAPRAGPSTRK